MNEAPREHSPADFYAAAIYGSILAASLIAVFRAEHDSPETIAFALLGTMAVFFLAHTWSAILGGRIHLGRGLGWPRIRALARAEWALLEAAAAPTLAFLLGWVGI